MDFFKHFPTLPYTFQTTSGTFALRIVNISAHIKIMERLKEHMTVFYDYVIQEGDRPDSVATKVYGSPKLTWVVLVVNDIFSLYDWPLTTDEFNRYICQKYGTVQSAQTTLLYTTSDGYFVDAITYAALSVASRSTTTAYDHETQLNENKRRIKILPEAFMTPLVAELKKVLAV